MTAVEALRALVEYQQERIAELEKCLSDQWASKEKISSRIDEAAHTLGRLSMHLQAAERQEKQDG